MIPSPYCEGAVADAYDRFAVPLQFAAPARQLVAAMGLRAGYHVLDVGAGTGAAAVAAAQAVGPAGLVIGIDPSLEMLGRLRRKGGAHVAAACAPDLPFRAGCFDAVTASFVLSHMNDVRQALVQMVRVLRPGGVLGVTSWGARTTPVSQVWNEVVPLFAGAAELKEAFQRQIPWDQWLTDAAHVHQALSGAGLRDVEIVSCDFPVTLSAEDYVSMKAASVEGACLRRLVTQEAWPKFLRELEQRFRGRFGGSVTYARDVHVAVGSSARGRAAAGTDEAAAR